MTRRGSTPPTRTSARGADIPVCQSASPHSARQEILPHAVRLPSALENVGDCPFLRRAQSPRWLGSKRDCSIEESEANAHWVCKTFFGDAEDLGSLRSSSNA